MCVCRVCVGGAWVDVLRFRQQKDRDIREALIGYALMQISMCKGQIPPDALRQRYGCGTSWPRSPQQIGSTLINESISTGRGCRTSQQRPGSGSPRHSAIIP